MRTEFWNLGKPRRRWE